MTSGCRVQPPPAPAEHSHYVESSDEEEGGFTLIELMIVVADYRHPGGHRHPELHSLPGQVQAVGGEDQPEGHFHGPEGVLR